MQLILAIDSDPRRSEQLAALVRSRLQVDLVQATSAGEGLHALGDRIPDLILTAPLLSPFDDGVLDEYLRDLGAAATHVQTVRIPVLGATPKKKSAAKRLFSLGRKPQSSSAAPDGCDPKVFADEIALYLTRSEEQKATAATSAFGASALIWSPEPEPEPEPMFEADLEPEPELVYEAATPEPLYSEPAVQPVYTSEPVYVEPDPEPAYAEPLQNEAAYTDAIDPEPLYAEPENHAEPLYVALEPMYMESVAQPYEAPAVAVEAAVEVAEAAVDEVRPTLIEPAPVVVNAVAAEPAVIPTPEANASGRSSSFEAALAAIRAAWVKPEGKVPRTNPTIGPVSGGPKPLGTAPAEVDLTAAIDDESSPEASKADPDDWAVFDPNECDFAALVNKLDEVTEGDEVSVRATTIVR
jgi:hypothetical protein